MDSGCVLHAGDDECAVGIDVAFFRNQFWASLMVNIGIALVFAAFYFRFHGTNNTLARDDEGDLI